MKTVIPLMIKTCSRGITETFKGGKDLHDWPAPCRVGPQPLVIRGGNLGQDYVEFVSGYCESHRYTGGTGWNQLSVDTVQVSGTEQSRLGRRQLRSGARHTRAPRHGRGRLDRHAPPQEEITRPERDGLRGR
jgi:hypothetical protein